MNQDIPHAIREIERASWSQGIQTLISILIGAALAVAVSKTQEAGAIDVDAALRLAAFSIYCVGFFWFYHKFYIFFYRRASVFSVLLPAIVGTALIATAHAVRDPRSFALWTLILVTGGAYATGVTAVSSWRGKYKVIDGLPREPLLHRFRATMLRSALLLTVMAVITAALIWGPWRPGALSLDASMIIANGTLFALMSFLNWLYFTRPIDAMVDGA